MATIDPDSPRQHGVDLEGVLRALGDIDSSGQLVGWIEPDGSCWKSRRECEISRAVGRYWDAFNAWNRAGGVLGVEPDPAQFVERHCSPDSADEALRDCQEVIEFQRLTAPLVGVRATLN
jgi:hypothetical protein